MLSSRVLKRTSTIIRVSKRQALKPALLQGLNQVHQIDFSYQVVRRNYSSPASSSSSPSTSSTTVTLSSSAHKPSNTSDDSDKPSSIIPQSFEELKSKSPTILLLLLLSWVGINSLTDKYNERSSTKKVRDNTSTSNDQIVQKSNSSETATRKSIDRRPYNLNADIPESFKKAGLSYNIKPSLDLDDTSIPMRERFVSFIQALQNNICQVLEHIENNSDSLSSSSTAVKTGNKTPLKLCSDYHLRDNNKGFGDPRVLQSGNVFEKAGCNISVINSQLTIPAIKQMRSERFEWWDGKTELPYFVAGCSLVVHPKNPHVPTIHFNYRYFEVKDPNGKEGGSDGGEPKAWWFGGGTDLTPSYLYEEDAKLFHGLYKKACDEHDPSYYGKFKKWCDDYFLLPFRGETRGIGGIFFDDLSQTKEQGNDPEEIFRFVRDCADQFLRAYVPIVERRKEQEFSEREKRWQQLRRGRYVEFNMNVDRGVRFGLAMKQPRVESILMSLPQTARWEYQTELGTEEGTEEKKILDILKKPVEWV